MSTLRMILGIIRSLFLYSFSVVSLAIAITIGSYFAIFSKSKTQPIQTAARIWGKFVMAISGIEILISGQENIPRDTGVLFVANHQSHADTVITLTCVPRNFIATVANNYYWLPIFGWGWKKAGYIPIFRDSPATFYLTVEKMAAALKAGESVFIFPEGTRSYDGKILEFKRASLLPALKSGAPIVPIAISGSFKILPRNSWIITLHPVKFTFGKPIYIRSEAEYDEKLKEVREAIARML